MPIARKLQEMANCNIFMLSYRGYGHSTGSPSETGIKIDAQAAIDWVWDTLATPAERENIVVYGQSIGGAVAIHAAASNPTKVRYLMVENTFLSIHRLIPKVAPFLRPFIGLCHQRWNSADDITRVTQTILFLVGERDELIPPAQMKTLHRLATRSRDRKLVSFPKGTHNDTCVQNGYFDAIRDFLMKKTVVSRVKVEEITDEDDY